MGVYKYTGAKGFMVTYHIMIVAVILSQPSHTYLTKIRFRQFEDISIKNKK